MNNFNHSARRTFLGIISAPFLAIFWVFVQLCDLFFPTMIAVSHCLYRMEFALALEIAEDLRHALLRFAHCLVVRFSQTIVRM